MTTISNGSAAQNTNETAAHEEATPRQQRRFSAHNKCHIRNLLSAAAIFFALMLILGAIILHINQKNHFGRMNIDLRQRLQQQQQENYTDIILPPEVVVVPATGRFYLVITIASRIETPK